MRIGSKTQHPTSSTTNNPGFFKDSNWFQEETLEAEKLFWLNGETESDSDI